MGLGATISSAQASVMGFSFGLGWPIVLGGKLLRFIVKFFLNKSGFECLNNTKIEN